MSGANRSKFDLRHAGAGHVPELGQGGVVGDHPFHKAIYMLD
jgi:hypothetical protein